MLDNQSWGGGFERPVNWDSLCLCVAEHGIVFDWVWGSGGVGGWSYLIVSYPSGLFLL